MKYPTGYEKLTASQKRLICNGCGAAWRIDVVPDNILGLDITEACNIHDYSWFVAKPTWDDFHRANIMFLDNMLELISTGTRWWWLKWARRNRAMTYFNAVEEFGRKIFADEKGLKD